MITKPVPALLRTPTGHNPTSRTPQEPELATALRSLTGKRCLPGRQERAADPRFPSISGEHVVSGRHLSAFAGNWCHPGFMGWRVNVQ